MASTNAANPSGLISFMCWVMYDRDTNEDFHSNERAVMNNFDLDQGTQEQIIAIGQVHGKPEAKQEVEEFFDSYLLGPFLDIWTAQIASSQSQPPKNQGWLSFMYYASWDKATNSAFRNRPDDVMAQFGLTDPTAVGKIKLIAEDPGKPEAKDAAQYIFNNYVVDELLQTKPTKFW